MSERLEVPSPEEFAEEELSDVVRRLIEVLNHEGFEYEIEKGFFRASLEVEEKSFPFLLYLSEASFLEMRLLLAGEPGNELTQLYPASIAKMQEQLYGRVCLDEDAMLCCWNYGGIPVSTDSLHDVFVRFFQEIEVSIGSFHHAFTAMEEGHTDEEVLEIVNGCLELIRLGHSPQTFQ